jgi:hypothetical protein
VPSSMFCYGHQDSSSYCYMYLKYILVVIVPQHESELAEPRYNDQKDQ